MRTDSRHKDVLSFPRQLFATDCRSGLHWLSAPFLRRLRRRSRASLCDDSGIVARV